MQRGSRQSLDLWNNSNFPMTERDLNWIIDAWITKIMAQRKSESSRIRWALIWRNKTCIYQILSITNSCHKNETKIRRLQRQRESGRFLKNKSVRPTADTFSTQKRNVPIVQSYKSNFTLEVQTRTWHDQLKLLRCNISETTDCESASNGSRAL